MSDMSNPPLLRPEVWTEFVAERAGAPMHANPGAVVPTVQATWHIKEMTGLLPIHTVRFEVELSHQVAAEAGRLGLEVVMHGGTTHSAELLYGRETELMRLTRDHTGFAAVFSNRNARPVQGRTAEVLAGHFIAQFNDLQNRGKAYKASGPQ